MGTSERGNAVQFFLTGLQEQLRALALSWQISGNVYTDPILTLSGAVRPNEYRMYRLAKYAPTSEGLVDLMSAIRRDFGSPG